MRIVLVLLCSLASCLGQNLINSYRYVAAVGTVFVNDTFTGTDGTNINARSGEVGATWTKVTGYTGDITIQANAAKSISLVDSVYYASGTPTSSEYDVEAVITQLTNTDSLGVVGRLTTDGLNAYWLVWDDGANQWQLIQTVSGTDSTLGTYTPGGTSAAATIKLQIRNATKKAFIDGVERISSTSNGNTNTGKAGIWEGVGNHAVSSGRQFNSITATNP